MPSDSRECLFPIAPGRRHFFIAPRRRFVSIIPQGYLISIVLAVLPLTYSHGTMTSLIIFLILLASCGLQLFGYHSFKFSSFCHINNPFFHCCTILSPMHRYLVESAVKTFCFVLVPVLPIFLVYINTKIVMYQYRVVIRLPLRPHSLSAYFDPSTCLASFLFSPLRLLAGIDQSP